MLQERQGSVLGVALDFPYPDACEAWGVDDLGDEFRAAVGGEMPVLFVSGTLDGNTPIENAEAVRRGFPNSGHIIVELMGHEGPGIWFGSPRVLELVGEFLRGAPPASTTVSAPPIDWVLPR